MSQKKGFTLAEVLITLGIIGVVATLTVPSLYANYQKKALSARLKKVYNEINAAAKLAVVKEKALNFYMTDAFYEQTFLKDYFKLTKDCGIGDRDYQGCFGNSYTENGSHRSFHEDGAINYSSHCVLTADLFSICLDKEGYGVLDINGPSGPNKFDLDTFMIKISEKGTISTEYSQSLEDIARTAKITDYASNELDALSIVIDLILNILF